jgi:hypothetical protein
VKVIEENVVSEESQVTAVLAQLQPGERLWAAFKAREARIEDYSGGMPC